MEPPPVFVTLRDRDRGLREEVLALLARSAGIEMPESRLLVTEHATGPRAHIAVRRFDREGATRIHYHSLAGLTHQLGSELDYETLLRVARRITRDHGEVVKAFRREVFNVRASNRDDHGKNHGFLYDPNQRQWRLSPAFDLTFVASGQLRERGLAVLGERRQVSIEHLERLEASEGIECRATRAVIEEVRAAIDCWPECAAAAGVAEREATEIGRVLAMERR